MKPIKVAHADDHEIFRKGVLLGFDKYIKAKRIDIILSVENGQELLNNLFEENLPDIILMDIRMPVLDGIEATTQIRILYPKIKIIPLTMYDDKDMINGFQQLGACGYLSKNTNPDEILLAIETVFHGGFYFNILNRKDYLI
jgi:DNA-binding NarL/FixJ family response regulator